MRYSPPVALFVIVAVLLAYAPSLPGGYLNWDDPWLVQENALLHDPSSRALTRIVADLGRDTRLSLGAEYLPLRDLTVWLELRLFGDAPLPQRLTNLGLYLAAIVLVRRAFRSALGEGLPAEVATAVFALHPAHVESVAWLAGRKDVLALLFTAFALSTYATGGASRIWQVPLCLAAAHLSKAATVVAVGLLLAQDLLMKRRPAWGVLAPSLLVAALAAAIHVHVGGVVAMTTAPAGGSRSAALMTMGPVVLRYVEMSVVPSALSLVHDVPSLTAWSAASVLGWLLVMSSAVAVGWMYVNRNDARPLSMWLWFFVPLLPVSQILFPLQNRMADRYLLFSVGAVALLAGYAAASGGRAGSAGRLVAAGFVGLCFVGTVYRASLFSEPRAVFADALVKTTVSPTPPYQLAMAFEAVGDDEAAMGAYEEVLRRQAGDHETARRATNNLARLHARHGELARAESVLRRGHALWPNDPKVLSNLARVLARQSKQEEATRLFDQLKTRHPGYGNPP